MDMTLKAKMQRDTGCTIGDLRNFYISKSCSTPSLKRYDNIGLPIRHKLYLPFLYPMRLNFFLYFPLFYICYVYI